MNVKQLFSCDTIDLYQCHGKWTHHLVLNLKPKAE